jgi:hypothetical protein
MHNDTQQKHIYANMPSVVFMTDVLNVVIINAILLSVVAHFFKCYILFRRGQLY